MYKRITSLTAVVLVVIQQIALAITTTLTERAGQNITLPTGITGLHGDVHIIWSHGSEQHVLIHFSDGKLIRHESQRYQLDRDTGSLTIGSLSVNDSGLYEGQIINKKRWMHRFNLTVVEADPTPPTAGPSKNLAAHQRSHTVCLVAVCLLIALCAVMAFRVRQKTMKGGCQEPDPAV